MKKEETNENEFLQELSPKLFDKRLTNNPSPPEGYFDGLADSVMNKIDAEANRKRRGKLIRIVNYKNIAIAAGIAVILALIPYLKSTNGDPVSETQIAAITIPANTEIDDLTAYLDENDLYGALENEGFENLSIDPEITEDQIIDYLLLEDINEDLLFETR